MSHYVSAQCAAFLLPGAARLGGWRGSLCKQAAVLMRRGPLQPLGKSMCTAPRAQSGCLQSICHCISSSPSASAPFPLLRMQFTDDQARVIYKRPTDLRLKEDVPICCNLLVAPLLDEGEAAGPGWFGTELQAGHGALHSRTVR